MTPHFGELTVALDGNEIRDERGHTIAVLNAFALVDAAKEVGAVEPMIEARARRLALAQHFAASTSLADAMGPLIDFAMACHGVLVEWGEPPQVTAARDALRKAGRL